jgi:hypothetical protein
LTEKGSTETTAAAVITEPISITSGDYIFTFLGITSGEDLSRNFEEAEDGSTYAVLAISKADGTLFDSESYYEDMTGDRFFVSPLIHGIAPWQGGATVMNGGGYTERIIDGVLYRIMDCDNIEIFADTGVSLAASTGVFFDTKAFAYDEATGKTTARSDFDGSAVIFELPFDKSLGDPAKAEQYWAEFESEATATIPDSERPAKVLEMEFISSNVDWSDVMVIEGTTKILTPDADGYVTYEYETPNGGSGRNKFLFDAENFEVGVPEVHGMGYSSDENGVISKVTANRYTLNEDGTLTAEVVMPNKIPEYNP